MVLTPIVSLAATERVTLQRASCVTSFALKEGLGRDIGIVEGWAGDEDEDVNIDSDEKDSGSEGLLPAAENLQLQCAPIGGSSVQLPNSSGMRERTKSSVDTARNEDLAGSKERAVTLNKADCPNVALEDSGLRLFTGKDQVGSFDGGIVENGEIATAPKGVRLGSSSEGSALEGAAKRLDARRFRRDFNVKTDSIPARIKPTVSGAGRMRGSSRSDAKEGEKLPEERDAAGGKAKESSSTPPHLRTTDRKGGDNVAGDTYCKGKRTFREEISKQSESVLLHMVLGGEQINKDSSKKRRLNDLDYAQAVERKSSLRVRGELSKQSEGRMRRETRGCGDAGPLAKIKRARKDEEVGEVGISVPEKQIPPKGGLEKAGKSPALLSTKAGRQKSAADNRNQRPPQVKGNCRKPSSKGADPRYCLSGDGAKKSDSGTAKETFELDSLEKVFERRPTKRKDKENETGDNPESKRLTGQSAVVLDLTDVSGGNLDQKTGKKENGKPVDRRPTRSADRAQGTEKTQQSGDASDESQTCILKQWQQGQRGGFNLRRTPTRIAKKGKDGSDRGHVLLRTKSATVMGTITVVEDTKKDLTNSGGDRHLLPNGLSGVELKMAGAEEIEVLQAEELDGKRKQSSEAEIETNRGLSHGGVIRQVGNLEVKEGTEREGFDVDRPAKSKIQKSTDWKVKSSSSLQENSTWSPSLRHLANIWHPKTPLSQCVAMSVSIADVDPNIAAASVDFLPKEALPRQIYGGNEKVLEEGEIGSSDSDGKQEVAKFAEPVLPREAKGETRFGVCENDLIHEDSKSGTMAIVQHNEPSLSKIQLRLGQSQAAVEKLDNMERIPLSEGVCDGKLRAVDALDTNCHVSPHASTVAGGEKSEPVAVAGGDRSDKVRTFSESASHENDCNERHSVQSDNQVDELCVLEDFPTMSHESLGRDQVGEWQSPSAYKLARSETSELQAVYDLIGEDRSDSEDGRVSDYHNSYCQSCRQGGELLCCDGSGCQITYHLECTEPKLWEVPSGNWYCPMCAHKRLSYGVHAVSKSVESIWDIRNSLQSSDHSRLWPKDVPANDLLIANDVDPRMRGRSLEGARGMHVESSDRVEDECIAAVAVYFDDEEGIAGIVEATSGPQGATQRTDEDTSVQRLTERREWDANVKMSEKSRSTEGKAILGCTLSANQGLKLAEESWDKEYFVKWRGISHAHNTWVGETELAKLSPKGLARFKKKLTDGQIAQWSSEWAEPQRLVDKRVSIPPRRPGGGRGRGFLGMDAQQEWFVKWKGLGYEHCTWEPVHSGVLSDPKVKQLEMMFDRWGEAARQRNHPHRVDQVDKLREESFKQLQSQPEWIRFGKLLPYQLDRLNQLRRRWHHRQNTVIVDQDEQEKSSTTVTFLLSLIEEYGVYRLILVVVPVFEIQCWEADITEYAPQVNTVVYTGGKEARGVIQRFELNRSNAPLRVQVVLTTCDIAFSDFDYLRKIKWEVVVVDESQQFKTAKSHRAFLQFDTGFWLLFISELSKYNVEELQQILFLFHPQSSSSTSTARKQLSGLDESGQLQYLKDQLSEHIVRNSRPDDASGLKLVECWVGTNMTSLQVQLYCNTLTKHYNLLQSGRLRSDPDSPSLHDFVTQLRLGCGKEDLPASQSLIDAGVEASEKWQLIHAMLSVLHVQHHRVVILSQSLMQLFFLDDYLRQKYGPDSYELVDTRYSALRKNSAVQRFNAKDSIRSFFLLRTGATGFSLKLKDKDIVIIHDSDLNPANDLEYLRKVLHRVDGKVTVFRLYQRFTVEEGSMVYDHQKKLRPDPKPLSVKSLQQLLRWKVQHILELDSSSSEKVQMPKGKHKVDLNDKATQNLKRVANILHGNFDMEFSSENHDEGWTEDDGDSVKEFWFSLLKDRHAELQDHKEQSNPGKGLRQRKRVQYSEEALALAPYSVQEEEEIRRKRRRPQLVESTSISVTHEKKDSSLHSLPLTPRQASRCHGEDAIQDNTLCSRSIPEVGGTATCELEVGLTAPVIDNIAGEQSLEPVLSDGVCEQHTQEAEEKTSRKAIISSVGKSLKKEELMRHAPADLSQVNKHQKLAAAGSVSGTTSQVDSGKRLRMEQKQLLLRMEPELSQIGDILQVASPLIPKEQGTEDTSRPRSLVEEGVCSVNRKESIAGYSQQLLSHVMNNFRMPKEPRELVVMVEMSLCLIASTHFHQVMDHLPAISLVAEKMNLPLKKEEFPSVYSRLEGMCKTFVAHPSALQGDTREEILLDEAAHVNISSQPTSAGTDSPVQIPPICGVSEASPFTNSNLHFSGGKQACVDQNDSLQDCVVLVSKPEMTLSAKDNLVRTELEQSEQPTQAGDCEVIGFKDVDATLHTHSDQLPATHNPEAMLGAGHLQRQPVAVSSEETQPPLLPVGTIRARLKSDRDQLLHSWLAKQKLEVQEFNTSCAQERDACQKSFQKQKDKILATGVNMEQRVEMLRYLGDVYASTLKLWERDEENQRQVMNSTQRDLRDTINALYTKLLQQVTTGTLPDLVSEARSMGLTFAMQSETPKFLEYGPAHTKYGHQIAVPQVQQSAQISLPDQNTDLGLLPSSLRAQTPPQSQEAASPPAPNSQPVFRIHSLPQHEAHLPPQVQLHCQRQPHFQHSDILQCSPVTTFSQPLSQALLSNPDREVSTPEELVAGQLQYSYPSPRRLQSNCRQQNAQTKARSQASCLHLNILESSYGSGGSEPVLDISCQGLERTHSGVEQEILHSPITEHARVSELINTSTTQEPVVSHTSQISQSRGLQTVQIPVNLPPRVTQMLLTPTSLQGRISQSVQASPSLQPRVSHTVIILPPQGSQIVDAPTSLQPRVSHIRRPLSIQHTSRHPPSLYHASAPQVRVQPQLQPSGGQGYSFPSACSSVGGTLLASQTRSNVHSQNVPLGAHSSQSTFGPDPLAHEENRLKREQEKLKLLYNEETTQIKTQYDREATELRRKYEGVLFERARIFEQKTTALKENLEKVDKNQQLAEALKLRSFLDQQKARQAPGHSTEATSGSAQVGRLSGVTAHMSGRGHLHPSHQTNVVRNAGRSIGRGSSGGVANSGPGPVAVTDAGIPNSTSQVVNVVSHIVSWQSSRSSDGQHVPPAGLSSGAPVSSALANCVPPPPGCFSSTGSVSVTESFCQTNPSLSSSSGPFSASLESVLLQPHSTTSSSMQQGRLLVSLQDGSKNMLVASSSARVEHLPSHHSNPKSITVLSSPTAPTISIATAVSSPTVTEAVVVSVSPVLSPVRDQLTSVEFAGNLFIQGGQNYLGSSPLSAVEVNDLLMPLSSENQVSSTLETRVRSGALPEAELEGPGARSHGHKGLSSSQPPSVGLNHNPQTPPVPVIYLSDDDD